jgi:hypothetical protein
MRRAHWFCAVWLLGLLGSEASAQPPPLRVRIDPITTRIGFSNVWAGADLRYCFKAGAWTPILVRFVEDKDGNIFLPRAVDGSISATLLVETPDNDSVSAIYPQKFTIAPNDPLEVVTYSKVTGTRPEIKITVRAGDKEYASSAETSTGIDVDNHLYLVLGDILPDFHDALVKMTGNQKQDNNKDTRPRYVAYENDVALLPTHWFGYEGLDLMFLTTTNPKFLDRLVSDRQSSPQLNALAEWVRRGGRLVVSVNPLTREKTYQVLASPAWRPALPRVLTADSKAFPMQTLEGIRNFSNAVLHPFPKFNKDGKPLVYMGVKLEAPPTVWLDRTEPDGKDDVPIVVRFPHGLGSITVMGFDVKDPIFTEWAGRLDFWQQVVDKLAPKVGRQNAPFGRFQGNDDQDLATRLHRELENFDTPKISFGWVVLFIFLYILVVGPLDYIVLKFVFKRLELTWITFPAVVLSVSLLAYFTAYAIKGQDLKVNKVDLVDIDLRSALGDDFQPVAATAYGNTWFAILSPRIQNYTVGIEPALHLWEPGVPAPVPPLEPTVSWMGRPEFSGMGAVGRGRAPSLFTRSYDFAPDAVGIRGVPIPVWTMRCFTGSWEGGFEKNKLPLESKITYEPQKVQSIEGTLKNNLPFDLKEAGFVYRGKFYALDDFKAGETIRIALDPQRETDLNNWYHSGSAGRPNGFFAPRFAIRSLLFHERVDPQSVARNHSYRALDFSWRLKEEAGEGRVKELYLVAKMDRAAGPLESLLEANDPRLPTQLWLGEIPGTVVPVQTKTVKLANGKIETVPVYAARPAMVGDLIQETYIRVILPVAPRKQ